MRPYDLVSTGPRTYGTTMISRLNFGDWEKKKSYEKHETRWIEKMQLFKKNIAKRQYLCIIFLINSLERYRYKFYSKFINRFYYLFILFSQNCIA